MGRNSNYNIKKTLGGEYLLCIDRSVKESYIPEDKSIHYNENKNDYFLLIEEQYKQMGIPFLPTLKQVIKPSILCCNLDIEKLYPIITKADSKKYEVEMAKAVLTIIVGRNFDAGFGDLFLLEISQKKPNPLLLYNIGVCYEFGLGCLSNVEMALKYYKESIKRVYNFWFDDAIPRIAEILSLKNEYTPASITWFKEAALMGKYNYARIVAVHFEDFYSNRCSVDDANFWYRIARKGDNAEVEKWWAKQSSRLNYIEQKRIAQENREYMRESWYAMTDGQYGDYPECDVDYEGIGF